jgi:hypothetical protein
MYTYVCMYDLYDLHACMRACTHTYACTSPIHNKRRCGFFSAVSESTEKCLMRKIHGKTRWRAPRAQNIYTICVVFTNRGVDDPIGSTLMLDTRHIMTSLHITLRTLLSGVSSFGSRLHASTHVTFTRTYACHVFRYRTASSSWSNAI